MLAASLLSTTVIECLEAESIWFGINLHFVTYYLWDSLFKLHESRDIVLFSILGLSLGKQLWTRYTTSLPSLGWHVSWKSRLICFLFFLTSGLKWIEILKFHILRKAHQDFNISGRMRFSWSQQLSKLMSLHVLPFHSFLFTLPRILNTGILYISTKITHPD